MVILFGCCCCLSGSDAAFAPLPTWRTHTAAFGLSSWQSSSNSVVRTTEDGTVSPSRHYDSSVGLSFQQSRGCRNTGTTTTTSSVSVRRRSVLQLQLQKQNEQETDQQQPLLALRNPVAAIVWLGLVAYTVLVAPGDLVMSDASPDFQLVQRIVENPIHPEHVNQLFYGIFSVFGPFPIILACITIPQNKPGKYLSSIPFVVAAAFVGFFALGPYLAVRSQPRTSVVDNEEGGVGGVSALTRNLLESKLLSWFQLAFLCYIPFAVGIVEELVQGHATSLLQGYVDLFQTSKLVHVSSIDLSLLHLSCAYLIPADYRLRTTTASDDDVRDEDGLKVALLAGLLPFFGPALYCALRPPLPPTSGTEQS